VNIHEKYIQHCIQLAKNGLGTTYPNPLVGSVVVHNNIIIGEGFHYQAGSAHAEVNAIKSVTNTSLLKKSTIYVNLEPCNHYGKTPPCADLIITCGIKKVVIGSKDPNPKVAGQGIERLRKAGCEVIEGVLEAECDILNKRFFTYQLKKRPYIILKWAQTQNGMMAPKEKKTKKPVWITNLYSRQFVHKMRAEEQAILVGTNTVISDNPSLSTRHWYGKNPIRIIIDKELEIPETSTIYLDTIPTIVITSKKKENTASLLFETINFSENIIQEICRVLYKLKIQSVIIEGGAFTLHKFIEADIWDEALVFIGETNFKEGISAPKISSKKVKMQKIQGDTLHYYTN